MKKIILSLIRQYLFWMLFFAFLRIVFLVYHYPMIKAEEIRIGEILASFWHALALDTSTTCYLLALPMIMLTIQGLFRANWMNVVNKVYTFLIIFIFSFIVTAELGTYNEWKAKLSAKAMMYAQHPKEAYQSISALQFFNLLAILIALTALSFFIYNRFFYRNIHEKAKNFLYPVIFLIVAVPLLFLGIRGGIRPIPISLSSAYYSHHDVLNAAAVNSGFNLATSWMEYLKIGEKNPYVFYDIAEARKVVDELRTIRKDTTVSILTTSKPNIVILFMESWSADLIESLGGEPGITPEFAALEKGGFLFTHFYASGNRSQVAMSTIFGGFPALPYTTITENPQKYGKLPRMPVMLQHEGYHTSFYFGGQLIYGNIKAYILHNQFDKIIEEEDIDPSIPRGRLGIHDEYLLNVQAKGLDNEKEPFFSVAFTMSSHSPYDQPRLDHEITWAKNIRGNENEYLTSAYYSDYSLGKYFSYARTRPWFKNTLFIIVADHSHNTYKNYPLESFEYRKIPFLLYGDVIKEEYRGKQIDRISSNIDIPATLLKQLSLNASDFTWSKNLFNPYSPEYAYFELNDGFGWKTADGEFVYDVRLKKYYKQKYAPGLDEAGKEKLIRQGKSYVQVLIREFLEM